MKRRRIIMFFAMIMSVAIIGVGFAAWIITAPTEDAVHEGNFNVDTVETEQWNFVNEWVTEDGTKTGQPLVTFGMPKDSVETKWLKNTEDTFEENLVFYLKITVDNKEVIKQGSTASLNLAILKPSKAVDKEEVEYSEIEFETSAAYIATPVIKIQGKDEQGKYTYTEVTELSYEQLYEGCVLQITFDWGTTTNHENPYNYYNAKAYTEELAEEAQDFLQWFDDILGHEVTINEQVEGSEPVAKTYSTKFQLTISAE